MRVFTPVFITFVAFFQSHLNLNLIEIVSICNLSSQHQHREILLSVSLAKTILFWTSKLFTLNSFSEKKFLFHRPIMWWWWPWWWWWPQWWWCSCSPNIFAMSPATSIEPNPPPPPPCLPPIPPPPSPKCAVAGTARSRRNENRNEHTLRRCIVAIHWKQRNTWEHEKCNKINPHVAPWGVLKPSHF